MKKISKKILSFVLSFVMILTMGMSGVVTESAKAADSANTVSLVYRGGASNYVQVNTDMPTTLTDGLVARADTPGCDFKQEGTLNVNQVNLNVTDEPKVVLTFLFSGTLSANDTIVWKKGTVFSFADTKYTLDADYTFTWDGSAWNARKDCILDMTLHGGASTYLQTRHTLPEGLTFDNAKSTLDYESSTNVPKERISFPASNIMSINFSSDHTCAEGDTFTWKAGSAFAFSMTNQYVYYTLQNTWVFTFTNNSWKTKVEVAVESVGGENYYLQPILNISSTDNGVTLSHTFNEDGGTLNNNGIASFNRNGQALLSVNLKKSATVGDTYVWNKGSTCVISGLECYFADTFVFTYTANGWKVEKKVPEKTFSFESCVGAPEYLQIRTDIPVDSECAEFDIQRIGTKQDDGITVFRENQPTQLLSFNYGNHHCSKGDTLKIKKGSTMKLQDGSVYVLRENWMFIFDGSAWSSAKETDITGIHSGAAGYLQPKLNAPAPTADGGTVVVKPDETGSDIFSASMSSHPVNGNALISINFATAATSGKHYIWNADSIVKVESTQYYLDATYVFTYLDGQWQFYKGAFGDINEDGKINSCDLVKIKKLLNDSAAYNIRYDLVTDKKISGLDVKRERYILVGADWSTVAQSKEVLLAENKFNGGGEFITFADRPADPTDQEKIKEYKAVGFNTSLVTGEYGNYSDSYATGASGEKTYILQSGEQSLELTVKYTSGSMFQVATNLPADGTYGDFSPTEKSEFEYVAHVGTLWYFQFQNMDGTVYLNPIYINTVLKDGESFTYKAGSKFQVGDTWYALEADYTVTFRNDYQAGVKNLDAEGLNVWIRNTGNNADYFTESRLALLQPYKDIIDGVYMNDEPFETEALYTYSKEKFNADEVTESFDTLGGTSATLFNENFANKYFHVNHVPVTSYNHYGESQNLSAYDATKYNTFFNNYVNNVLNKVTTSDEKKTIGFDNYPFGYSSTNKILWWTSEKFNTTGIEPTYLLNLLIPAQVAKKEGNTYSVCIQTYDKITKNNETRVVDTKEEITMQIYAAMACGADMLEYFLYNTLPASANSTAMPGMIAEDGSKRPVYTATMNANKEALPFADVVKTFTWEGAEFFSGTSNKNSDGKNLVNNSSLNLVLSNSNDGVLNSASATDDVLVGYYTKDAQDAYMLANFNDPKQVTNSNSVTLNFGDCNYARVYTGTADGLTSEIVSLNNGSYTFTLQPGGGCFVIPVNAAS